MADEINVFPASTGGLTEQIKRNAANDEQQILRLNILKDLLKFLKYPNQKYMLSASLQYIRQEYDEKDFCQELLILAQEGYIEISVIGEPDDANRADTDTAKQLIDGGCYDKILIAIKEQQSGLLLHNFVDVNIAMLEMKSQFCKVEEELKQQKDILEQHNKEQQDISKINSEFQQKYNEFTKSMGEFDSKQKDLEKQIDQGKKDLTGQVESKYNSFVQELNKKQKDIENSAVSGAKNKAVETIEDEIKSTGKIGQAMQDAQKSIIQYLAIFVAIFALVNINVEFAAKWSYAELFRVNVIMTTSMATLVTLVHMFTDKEHKWFKQMIMLLAVLWIVLAVSVFIFA